MLDDEPNDELLLTDEVDEQDPGEDQPQDSAEDEIAIEIDGEDPGEDSPPIRRMRNRILDQDRELAEYRRANASKPVEIGPKPDLWEDCEGDPDKYETALIGWHERQRQVQSAQTAEQQQAEVRNREFERAKARYEVASEKIKLSNREDAEKQIKHDLGSDALGFIIQYLEKPANMVAALHQYPNVRAKIADEPDKIRQILMLHDLQKRIDVKTGTRAKPPAPEADTIVRGSAALSASSDKELARLEKDADRTGNRTAVIAYKNKKGIK